MTTLTCTPAYGRDYKSQKAVKADWAAGRDFAIATLGQPGYINKEDADRGGITVVIRYNRNLKSMAIAPAKVSA